MNELEFLRSQVRLERLHLREQRAALGTLLRRALPVDAQDACAQALAAHLVFLMRRFVLQDRSHVERLGARVAAARDVAPEERQRIGQTLHELAATLDAAQAATGSLADALEQRRHGALDAAGWLAACREFDAFYEGRLAAHRHALGTWLETYYDIGDWRRSSHVDPESVFEERRLHELALAALAALPPA